MNTVSLRVQAATAMAVLVPLAAVVLIQIVAHPEGRERARGAPAVSSQKMIVKATKMYADDWDTRFPVFLDSKKYWDADTARSSPLAVSGTFELLYPWEKRQRWPGLYIQQWLSGGRHGGE